MPIRIVRKGQTWTKTIDGSTFTLQKEEAAVRQALSIKHLQQSGKPPEYISFAVARLEASVVGWEGVVDADGQPVPFDKAMMQYIGDDVRADLIHELDNGPPPLILDSGETSPPLSGLPNGESKTTG